VSLQECTLNPAQAEAVRQLRAGIAVLAGQGSSQDNAMVVVKVPK
jgi:hypothetical protein